MRKEAVGGEPTTGGDRPAGGEPTAGDPPGDVTGGITWADIYESPQVERSLRRLPQLCREGVQLVWAAGRRELLAVLAVKAVNGAAWPWSCCSARACSTR